MSKYKEIFKKRCIEISEEAKINIYFLLKDNSPKYLENLMFEYSQNDNYYNELGLFLYLYKMVKFDSSRQEQFKTERLLRKRLAYSNLLDNEDNNYKCVLSKSIDTNFKIKWLTFLYKITPFKNIKEKLLIKCAKFNHLPSKLAIANYYERQKRIKESMKYFKECAFLGDLKSIDKMIRYYDFDNDIKNKEKMLLCGMEINNSYIEKYYNFANDTNNIEYFKRFLYFLFFELTYNYYSIDFLAKIYEEGYDSLWNKLCAYLLYESCNSVKYKKNVETLKEDILKECFISLKNEATIIKNKALQKEIEQLKNEVRLKNEKEQRERKEKEKDKLKNKTLKELLNITDVDKIREIIVNDSTKLSILIELINDNSEKAKSIVEKCYKYNKLSQEEEKMFSETKLNSFTKFIFATTYKNHNKQKYVKELLRLYKEDYIQDISEEINNNKLFILNDDVTREIFETNAKENQTFYFIELLINYYKDDNEKTLNYHFMLANQYSQTSIRNIIEYYLNYNLPIDQKFVDIVMKFDDINGYNNFNIIIDSQIARFYKYGYIKKRKTKEINKTIVYKIFRQASYIYGNKIIEKFASIELAKCYQEGYGVEVNKQKALELLNKYNPIETPSKSTNNYIEKRIKITNDLFKKYPCKEYDLLCQNDKAYAELIFNKCKTWDEETIIKNLKRRDYLLSIGLTMYEIYGKSGIIIESNIKDLVASKEALIKSKNEVKVTPKQVVNHIQTTPKQTTIPVKETATNVTFSKPKVENKPKLSDEELLKELKAKYNAPIKPEYNSSIHGSLKKFEKVEMEEYRKKEEEYRKKLLNVAPIIENGNKDLYKDFYYNIYKFGKSNGYKHEYSDYYNKIHTNGKEGISLEVFNMLLTNIMQTKYNTEDIVVEVKSFYNIKETYCLERLVLGLPTTLKELNVTLTVRYISYSRVESSYLEAYEEFKNSELSKILTWDEVSDSSKSDIGASIYVNDYYDRLTDNLNKQKAKEKLKAILFYEVRQLFNTYNIFYNQVMKINDVSRTIPLRFKNLSTTIKWELLN